jgi:LmbE family N-acetylglucosaminyl deacetylase
MAHLAVYAHIYLSPHLDDAVFSCAGRIWQQSQAGDSVAVVTAFAGCPDDGLLSPYAQALHKRWGEPAGAVERRRAEDQEALTLLGAEAVHWQYMDCIYRTTAEGDHAYASEEALFGSIHSSEAALIDELTGRLRGLALASEGRLYVPWAAGGHVDHRIVRRAAEGTGRALTYYEDFPYARHAECLKAALEESRLQQELVTLSAQALETKVAAMASYRSQLSTFWRDRADLRASMRTSAQRIGGGAPAERYWRVTST